MYEVNANGNRSYSSTSARSVASVAAAWAKQGHQPKAYAIVTEPTVRTIEVPVTSAKATQQALADAVA